MAPMTRNSAHMDMAASVEKAPQASESQWEATLASALNVLLLKEPFHLLKLLARSKANSNDGSKSKEVNIKAIHIEAGTSNDASNTTAQDSTSQPTPSSSSSPGATKRSLCEKLLAASRRRADKMAASLEATRAKVVASVDSKKAKAKELGRRLFSKNSKPAPAAGVGTGEVQEGVGAAAAAMAPSEGEVVVAEGAVAAATKPTRGVLGRKVHWVNKRGGEVKAAIQVQVGSARAALKQQLLKLKQRCKKGNSQ